MKETFDGAGLQEKFKFFAVAVIFTWIMAVFLSKNRVQKAIPRGLT